MQQVHRIPRLETGPARTERNSLHVLEHPISSPISQFSLQPETHFEKEEGQPHA